MSSWRKVLRLACDVYSEILTTSMGPDVTFALFEEVLDLVEEFFERLARHRKNLNRVYM
jgi:hypothetical protein